MAPEVLNSPNKEKDVGTLVSGIIGDVQDLIKQQLALTRKEIEADLAKSREAASFLALGIGLLFLATFFYCLMLAHLLHWWGLPPPADPVPLPLWGCYAVVGVLLTLAGALLVLVGKKKFASFNPLPDQSAQALKENVEWIANPK